MLLASWKGSTLRRGLEWGRGVSPRALELPGRAGRALGSIPAGRLLSPRGGAVPFREATLQCCPPQGRHTLARPPGRALPGHAPCAGEDYGPEKRPVPSRHRERGSTSSPCPPCLCSGCVTSSRLQLCTGLRLPNGPGRESEAPSGTPRHGRPP